jgi:spore germination protein
VRRGESLASIARAYGVSMQALVQANGLQDPNQVKVGQLLVIPN